MKHKHSILASVILCGFVCLLLLAVDTCKGKQNQGIGHRGGMRVVLEASVVDVVKAMANPTTSPAFNSALAAASQKYQTDGGDFVSLLGDAWEQAAPGKRLAGEFSYERKAHDTAY